MQTNEDIERAVERVQAGNVEDYEVVVKAFCRQLRTWLAGFAPAEFDPDELTQIAFVEAYRNLGRYRAGTDFVAWLKAIARNSLLRELRREGRERARRRDYFQELEVASSLEALERHECSEQGELGDRTVALRGCLELLPDEAKEMIRLRYDGSSDLRSIADSLGKSLSAVKFRLHWLRAKLRDCIKSKLAQGTV